MYKSYKMSVQEFCADDIKRKLNDAHGIGQLEKELRNLWRQYVPAVYSLKLDADSNSEERKSRKFLFSPMEIFLCKDNPEYVFNKLKELDNPPQLCGKVFKLGEPTYSCRDCGVDPTCVLCIECFQNSAHKNHRYRMSTSGGGGYCDCGDQEAWKNDPFCEVHQRGVETNKTDPTELLPADLADRAKALFLAVIRYASEMMLWVHPDSLPSDLKAETMMDTYVTMLFNDEVHTYEQVITTLQKAVDASQKAAVDFATTVDREGRSPVKYGKFDECSKAKEVVVKNTSRAGSKPLKVDVMHTTVVAHQIFASKILTWLQGVVSKTEGLRKLFCLLLMEKQHNEEHSILEKVMLADTVLWKAARVQTHQLFMSGVLMDQECKRKFSILFTKMYQQLMQQFIEDDHDHSVCAVSETVQIFTVPTLLYPKLMGHFIQDDHERKVSILSCSVQIFTNPTVAKMLIAEYNLLQVILDTFLAECENKKKDGKFAFEKQDRHHSFRRAQYALYDLKYALVAKPSPEEWTANLRQNFINGYNALLQLLKYMQGMDSVKRQTGQHIEFEPEWEGAFNLQLKLEDNIAIMVDWCQTDRDVLLRACECTIKALEEKEREDESKLVDRKVASHVVRCIDYNVAKDPVSIHLPVTRILANLFPQASKFSEAIQDIEALIRISTLTPEQLIEPSLRCLVIIAQTQANMWKRNGYSLLNQIYFYHNVRCRTQMYDCDILMLQAGATIMDANHFIVHLLNKFGLNNWIKDDYDQTSQEELLRQIITLAEEFLNLIINVLMERYIVGLGNVTKNDVVKNEIIHLLCLNPMLHSELSKSLPDDPYHDTGLDDVVNDVADFKKPTSSQSKGMYELKPECYAQYNPYFYHYSRADQSKSEEVQRKRKKIGNEDQALPPPFPPAFAAGFSRIINLLTCDVMIYMMKLILQRSAAKKSRSWSETQLEKVLFLIGIALHEEKRAHDQGSKSFNFIERATHGEPSVLNMLESLVNHQNVQHEAQKDLLAWVLKRFQEIRQLIDASFEFEAGPITTSEMDEKLAKERKKKADKAAKRRERIMAQMSRMQRNFIAENSELFESTSIDDIGEIVRVGSDMDLCMSNNEEMSSMIALGPEKSSVSANQIPLKKTCILCQEEQEITHGGKAMVIAAFVQRSTVLSKNRGKTLEDPEAYNPLFTPADLFLGAHSSLCSHVMHADCWQRFYDNVILKERRRTLRFRHHLSYDIDRFEYLCPYCKTLSNTVIPLVPAMSTLVREGERKQVDLSFNDWLDGIQKTVHSSIQEARDKESQEEAFLFVPCPLSSITKMMAESVAKNFQLMFEYVYDDSSVHFHDSINDMLKKFSTDVYKIGLGVHPDDENERVPMMAWNTCAFTIMSIEHLLRHDGRAVFDTLSTRQEDCLSALVRFAAVSSNVIQKDLIKKHCVTLLSALVCDSASKRLQETPCILELDVFHYLVSLCMSLPSLYAEVDDEASSSSTNPWQFVNMRVPICDLGDLHLLQFAITAHIVQIMLSLHMEHEESMDVEGDRESEEILQVYKQLRQRAGCSHQALPSAWNLLRHMKEAVIPFLRSCALLFHYLGDVKASDNLLRPLPPQEEYESLCQYLSLPTDMSHYFGQGQIIQHLITSWCDDETVKRKVSNCGDKLVSFPLKVNRVEPLPQDYSQLINKVSTFTCPNSDGDDSRAPTMCLVCGEMLCSQSYCCQTELDSSPVGAATAHAHVCGAGTGLFLRVRECQILLLSNRTKGCFYSPPYLDDYGETDQGLRRGNPLHLCPERYAKLQKLWLSHSIPEEIAHHLESNTNLITIEWNHL